MKNIILTSILLGVLLFLSFSSFSQNLQWSFRADAGVSKIPFYNESDEEVSLINFTPEKSKPAFTWSYGCQVEKEISKNLFINTGMSYTILRDQRFRSFPILIVSGPGAILIDTAPIERKANIKSSNIIIPLSLTYRSKRLGFHTGIQTLYSINAEMTIHEYVDNGNGNIVFDNSKITTELDIKKFDYGALGGLSYKLNKSISIQTELYWGLKNIDKFSSNFKRKNQRLTIGLSYHFI